MPASIPQHSYSVAWVWPNRYVACAFIALCLSNTLFNTIFHVEFSVIYKSYSPGLITALMLYPVSFWYVVQLANNEHLLNGGGFIAALLIGGVVHCLDVYHDVLSRRSLLGCFSRLPKRPQWKFD